MTATAQPALTEAAIREALSRVLDPEFGLNLVDLGLIYEIAIHGARVCIAMTLTSMHCPAGQVMMDGVHAAAAAVPGVAEVEVTLVWDPMWSPEMLSDAARRQLGWRDPSGD